MRMSGGCVLSNKSFANFFGDLNADVFGEQKYPGFRSSKANRLRACRRAGRMPTSPVHVHNDRRPA